ncbi:MAG TPA: hypothetical protein PKM57_00140 [Kiritimatiellia bacterium]|nr:hypothetical protein [Kiritimatiellia bacterium]
MSRSRWGVGVLAVMAAASGWAQSSDKRCVSGIYPALAMYNGEGECGTGAVVPWADRLWVVTYAPHMPKGSTDKFYEITPDLTQIVRPESIGGTPANRMIHRESQQLFIGPYVVDKDRNVRVIPWQKMFGRLTGNARHLTDPAGKIYYATMEEGFYEVDVKTLAVTELFKDGNAQTGDIGGSLLPGYHGKGFYSGQGRVVYANNGERGARALVDPSIPSGVLAEWEGPGKEWRVVRRNQFTEVTGPGGVAGNANSAADPVWSVGWDHRSLILMLLDNGVWHAYRLPKGSHSYDGAHGWNTEWPRIREIGESDLLMTMHGTFWHFPRTFSASRSAGIAPRSNYLKVVGDFCRWGDRVVLGCDDSAQSEFLNKRRAKGTIKGPGQSHSNLWFVDPSRLDRLGPAIGRGAVWSDDAVQAGAASDPYLFAGYAARSLALAHGASGTVRFTLEVDRAGDGTWTALRDVEVPAGRLATVAFAPEERGAWVRLVPRARAEHVYACFQYANPDARPPAADAIFAGLATPQTAEALGGIVYARGGNKRTLALAAVQAGKDGVKDVGFYELDAALSLKPVADPDGMAYARKEYGFNGSGLEIDAASAVVTDDSGRRWRFPKSDAAYDRPGLWGRERLCREVCTERDLLNVCGTFYELPAENADGFGKVRAVATHGGRIHDYCSYRGLLVLSGVDAAAGASEHIVRSEDGRAAVWVGVVDDLWAFGKPRGQGGPWKDTAVKAGEPSDAYLMTGFDKKRLTLSQTGAAAADVTVEMDITGKGVWRAYATCRVESGKPLQVPLDDVRAYWLRVTSHTACTATAWLVYE